MLAAEAPAAEPSAATARRIGSPSAILAGFAALGLGALASVMMLAGHQPWDGPEVASLSATHGLHEGDVFALAPLVVAAVLARWCWTRR